MSGRAFMPIEVTEQYKKSTMAPVMETRGSKFCKFQEARLQEMADEVRGGKGMGEVRDAEMQRGRGRKD